MMLHLALGIQPIVDQFQLHAQVFTLFLQAFTSSFCSGVNRKQGTSSQGSTFGMALAIRISAIWVARTWGGGQTSERPLHQLPWGVGLGRCTCALSRSPSTFAPGKCTWAIHVHPHFCVTRRTQLANATLSVTVCGIQPRLGQHPATIWLIQSRPPAIRQHQGKIRSQSGTIRLRSGRDPANQPQDIQDNADFKSRSRCQFSVKSADHRARDALGPVADGVVSAEPCCAEAPPRQPCPNAPLRGPGSITTS